ncbi:GNAT family N-acetyltransferase [Streptomyces pinistramenti]|uniref:GNAT family N-acetyltransferase n=1 Tax=Streptomyces pinistramenti TaxID=2884812 RepID=UPI001D087FB4|nr:GNAT family N-acetyltransferase [Streptomyces pinistramenti]MCB5906080.1 GNAT family N-acetyltransferase [Streptomyces pinistramenti]
MTWTTTRNPEAFEAAAGGFLHTRPVEHTVLLSVAAALRTGGADTYGDEPPRYGWWRQPDGRVGGAFLWTPPRPVLLSPMPDGAAAALADALARERCRVPGVNAGPAAAASFAAAWQRHHGGTARPAGRHRLYRLGALRPPDPAPPGAARWAGPADRELLVSWFADFAAAIGSPPPRSAAPVDDRIAAGRCLLWEDGGRPVAMASRTGTVSGAARIAPVHTPPGLRGRGYAGAVTAALSQRARDAGTDTLVLFTDLANPTSNSLYQRLGYRPVEDHLVLEFHGTTGTE